MTPWEYSLRVKAHLLNENDDERRIYTIGFANRLFKAEKKGRFIFKDVKNVYDYEKNERRILNNFDNSANSQQKNIEELYEMRVRLQRAKERIANQKEGGK